MRGRLSYIGSIEGAQKTLLAIIIVALLITSTLGVFLFVSGSGSSTNTVKSGSKIKVDYIGMLPDGRVFDTSLYTVAVDNTTYPKSLFFSMRGNETKYSPLEFTVGGGTMIKGFDRGVLGMKVGDTWNITISPVDGYGNMVASKLTTINLNETYPVYKQMTTTVFKNTYGTSPVQYNTVKDPKYGWNVTVLSVDSSSSTVTIMNRPSEGMTYKVYGLSSDSTYGWNAVVTSINASKGDNGEIIVHNQLNSSSALHVKGYDSTGKFFIESVNEAAGTAVINRNGEYVGRTLTFTVTLVQIE